MYGALIIIGILHTLLLLLSTAESTLYVSLQGNDTSNECSIRSIPCKSFRHAISQSKDQDEIQVLQGDLNNQTEDSTKDFHGNGGSTSFAFTQDGSLEITKSLRFVGVGGRPLLLIPTDAFAFVAKGLQERINVSFINFEIAERQEHELEKSKSCYPGSHGFITVQGANIDVRNCVMRRICNAINVVRPKAGLTEVKLLENSVKNVHYFVYSKNVSMITLEMKDTNIEGENDSPVPYYAVSLIIMDAAVVHITGCVFRKLNEAVAVSIHHGKLVMKLSHCQFLENSGQSVLLSFTAHSDTKASIVHFDRLEFTNNDGGFASSLHLVRSWDSQDRDKRPAPEIHLTRSVFRNNYAQAFFGAIYADGIHLEIHSTLFNNNTAGNELSAIQAFGGAIFVESLTKVRVTNSSFVNNTCSGFGGGIFSRGYFSAFNCEFRGSSRSKIKPLLGDILYATAGLHLENTTWYPDRSYRSKVAIWHPGSPTLESWSIRITGYFTVYCPVGHNITAHGLYRQPGMVTDRISMGCRSCPRDQYSLQSGHFKLFSIKDQVISHEISNVSCFWCRYGGVCERGHIRSRSNYYGYITGHPQEVKFISCPLGYCCQGIDCVSYNSCNPLRRGSLCGSCAEGLTENLLSASCVKKDDCKDRWFWLIYFLSGVIYISFFMYLDRISAFLKGQLIWWEEKLASIKEGSDADQTSNDVTGDDEAANEDVQEGVGMGEEVEDAPSNDLPSEEKTQPINDSMLVEQRSNQGDVFSNVINITFYFYQMILIIRDHDNAILSETLVVVKEISTSIFTFSLDSESSLSLCPFAGLSPVSKSLLVRSFAIYVIALLVLLNTAERAFGFIKAMFPVNQAGTKQDNIHSYTVRLRVTTIQITLLAYSTITNMTMNFVNCVPINGDSVLYMDGTIKCFTWWQFFAILFIIFWIIPFPIALVLGISRLQENTMSYHKFIAGLTFPFCFILYCLLRKVICCLWVAAEEHSQESGDGDEILNVIDSVEQSRKAVESSSIQEILWRFEAPFKEEDPGSISTKPGFWQGVLIMRRLIIIIMFTFINNPVTRLYFIFTACLFFLMHHLLYLPYKKEIINFYETFSSATLVMFCSINIFFAYSYVSNVPPENADAKISLIFDWFEVIILVLFPLLFCCLLLILVAARIFASISRVFIYRCRKID